jgi:hypothetical protein
VLRPHLAGFALPERAATFRPKLEHWADLLASGKADKFKEQEILRDFLADCFCELLGYTRPMDGGDRYTVSWEKHVEVDGKYADAVLGQFRPGKQEFVVALEGKGPKDPLDRPFAGRHMSAVDQGYRYAINLPCDWIIVRRSGRPGCITKARTSKRTNASIPRTSPPMMPTSSDSSFSWVPSASFRRWAAVILCAAGSVRENR